MKGFKKDLFANMRLNRQLRQARKHPSPTAWATLGERHLAAGEADQALAIVEEGLQDFPTNDRLLALRQAIQKENLRERVRGLRQSIRRRPDPYLYARLADVFRELGELNKAERIAEECKGRFPSDENPYLVIGEIRAGRFRSGLMARDGKIAIDHLEQAIQINPENYKARLQLAEIYAALGANSRALPHLLHLAEETPEDPHLRDLISEVGARPVEEGDVASLLRVAERKRGTPYDFQDADRRAAADEAPAPAVELPVLRRGSMALFAIREVVALYVASDEHGVVEARENPQASGQSFSNAAAKILKAAKASSRKMDMGGFAKGFLEGSFGRIVLRRTHGVELALLLEGNASFAAVARHVDAFFDGVFGQKRKGSRAGRS